MKRLISAFLLVVLCLSVFAACAPGGGTTGPGKEDLKGTDGEILVSWFKKAVADAPKAGARELIETIAQKPCFRMFFAEETEYYYPGFDYEIDMSGITKAALLSDRFNSPMSLIYIFTLKDGDITEYLKSKLDLSSLYPYGTEELPDMEGRIVTAKEGDKLLFAILQPGFDAKSVIEGDIAEKPRDLVKIFLDRRAQKPDESPLELAEFLRSRQKIAEMYTQEAEPGELTGFERGKRIEGFKNGAILNPMMWPSTFICYVFKLEDGSQAESFAAMLKKNADLMWNICVAANTVITEISGDTVLFMMCSE